MPSVGEIADAVLQLGADVGRYWSDVENLFGWPDDIGPLAIENYNVGWPYPKSPKILPPATITLPYERPGLTISDEARNLPVQGPIQISPDPQPRRQRYPVNPFPEDDWSNPVPPDFSDPSIVAIEELEVGTPGAYFEGDRPRGELEEPIIIDSEVEENGSGIGLGIVPIVAGGVIVAGLGRIATKVLGTVFKGIGAGVVIDEAIGVINEVIGGNGEPGVGGGGNGMINGTNGRNGCGPCAGTNGNGMATFRKAVRQAVINATGKCISHDGIRAVAREMGIVAAAPCLGLDACDLAIYVANPPKRRGRGISSAQIRRAGATARRVQTAHERLSKQMPVKRRTTIGRK